MRLVAIDPGETTGWAVLDWNEVWPPDLSQSRSGNLPMDIAEIHSWLHVRCQEAGGAKVQPIIENFRLFPGSGKPLTGNVFYPVRIIGWVQMTLYLDKLTFDLEPLCFQEPSIQQNWPDTTLVKYGMNLKGTSPHQRSATKHLLQWAKLYSVKHPSTSK